LVVSVGKGVKIDVGALGTVNFERGLYAYVGSAQNGLEKRVERHLRKVKRRFWHIDYLLSDKAVKILKVFRKSAGRCEECELARKISEEGVAIRGFGSSDCKCKSHLFKLEDYHFLRELMQ